MTPWDKQLIDYVYSHVRIWEYQTAFDFIELADTDEAKYKINAMAELLFDRYQEGYYNDPTKEKDMQGVWGRAVSLVWRPVQKLLAKRKQKVYKTEI